MTKQTWTAAVSALCFLGCALIIALTPTQFVTIAPGATYDLLAETDGAPILQVTGAETYPTTGRILTAGTTQSEPESAIALPEVLYAYWSRDREPVPRDWFYRAGTDDVTEQQRQRQQVDASRTFAAAAAMRSAGIEVRQIPMVQTVAAAGPAADKLFPGDFVLQVDGEPLETVAEITDSIRDRGVGELVTLTLLRNQQPMIVTLETAASNTAAGVPVWGGTLVMGYSYTPQVTFGIDLESSAASDGLMLGLALFDRLTDGDLVGDAVVSGAGNIDGAGNVSRVNGIRERLAAAERAGATTFLVPMTNCEDLVGYSGEARIVSASTLDDAIQALDALADPSTADLVQGCA
ncbi:MAG: PDZ domain-containing protein [Propioniciclava sp.]